MSGTTRAGT
ncbi:unnamed protein product, partial [Rotaria magnacalcarata]